VDVIDALILTKIRIISQDID